MRQERVRVYVVDYGRQCLYARYVDPMSRKQVVRSTGTASKKEAERFAAKWEAEVQEGRYKRGIRADWRGFRDRLDMDT